MGGPGRSLTAPAGYWEHHLPILCSPFPPPGLLTQVPPTRGSLPVPDAELAGGRFPDGQTLGQEGCQRPFAFSGRKADESGHPSLTIVHPQCGGRVGGGGGGFPLLSPVAFGKPVRSNETLSLRTLLFHAPEYDSLNSWALPSPRGLPDAPQVGVGSS